MASNLDNSSGPLLEVRGLKKSFDNLEVLKGIDFSLDFACTRQRGQAAIAKADIRELLPYFSFILFNIQLYVELLFYIKFILSPKKLQYY